MARGCESENTAMESQFSVEGKHIWRCPKAVFRELSDNDKTLIRKLLNDYWFFMKGFLPKGGGIDNQDERIMSVMPIIDKYVNEFQFDKGREGR